MKFITWSLITLFFSLNTYSQITFKWFGVTGFMLSDEKTTIVFDPAITRIGPLDYLPFRTVKTDEAEVDYWMNRCGVKSASATFVNHAHTDHVIDAPYVVKKFGGKLYGSSSVVNVGLGHGLPANRVQQIKPGYYWTFGDFKIQPFLTPHPPHFLDTLLLDGHINKPLPTPTAASNYLVGDTFSFLITHPKGRILFQSVAEVEQKDTLKNIKADVVLLSIANRSSTEHLIEKRINPSQAKTVIPLHHDNFLFKMRRDDELDYLWGVKASEFTETLEKNSKAKIYWPKYCESKLIL